MVIYTKSVYVNEVKPKVISLVIKWSLNVVWQTNQDQDPYLINLLLHFGVFQNKVSVLNIYQEKESSVRQLRMTYTFCPLHNLLNFVGFFWTGRLSIIWKLTRNRYNCCLDIVLVTRGNRIVECQYMCIRRNLIAAFKSTN